MHPLYLVGYVKGRKHVPMLVEALERINVYLAESCADDSEAMILFASNVEALKLAKSDDI